MTSVLISGASVAGPALAYWLRAHGMDVTLVERSDGPRRGGQAIDVRGAAIDVITRMGVVDRVREHRTGMRGVSIVDAEGNEVSRDETGTMTGGPLDSPDIEINRDDLTAILLDALPADTEIVYNDTVTAVDQDDTGALVTFERSPARRFDLVVGADGVHSRVRSLVFGDESRFAHHLGRYLAIFSLENTFGLDRWQTFMETPDGMVGLYSARNPAEARGLIGFAADHIDYDHRDLDAQRRLLAERFAGTGWKTPELLKAMWTAPDFYFDAMTRIVMDSWWSGRVALIGDAAHCPTPMSGQGTSLALVGAYVLAGELTEAGGDHTVAFPAYQAATRDFVTANQALADHDGPTPWDQLSAVANSITLKDYTTA